MGSSGGEEAESLAFGYFLIVLIAIYRWRREFPYWGGIGVRAKNAPQASKDCTQRVCGTDGKDSGWKPGLAHRKRGVATTLAGARTCPPKEGRCEAQCHSFSQRTKKRPWLGRRGEELAWQKAERESSALISDQPSSRSMLALRCSDPLPARRNAKSHASSQRPRRFHR